MSDTESSENQYEAITYEEMYGVKEPDPDGRPLELDIDTLLPFPNQPFHPYKEDEMTRMVESIKENGVISPIIVRSKGDKTYEIISGHNRVEACRRAGITRIPCFIQEVDDDTAVVLMVDSNLHQREQVLPSEKARAYRLKMDALQRSAGRYPGNCDPSDHNYRGLRTRDIIGVEGGDSGAQVQRYLRLNNLTPSLLEKVDDGTLNLRSAVELSHLTPEEQETVQTAMEGKRVSPSVTQARSIRRLSESKTVTDRTVGDVLADDKQPAEKPLIKNAEKPSIKKERTIPERTIRLRWTVLSPFFAEETTDAEIEQTIISLLQKAHSRAKSRKGKPSE